MDPGGHSMPSSHGPEQLLLSMPSSRPKVRLGHGVAVALDSGQKEPAGHLVQLLASAPPVGLKVPAGQACAVLEVEAGGQKWPGVHRPAQLALARFVAFPKVAAGQGCGCWSRPYGQ